MRGFDFDKALVALQNELHCFAYKLTADKDEAENLDDKTHIKIRKSLARGSSQIPFLWRLPLML
mgnify:CR=1 FL=1